MTEAQRRQNLDRQRVRDANRRGTRHDNDIRRIQERARRECVEAGIVAAPVDHMVTPDASALAAVALCRDAKHARVAKLAALLAEAKLAFAASLEAEQQRRFKGRPARKPITARRCDPADALLDAVGYGR